VTAVVGLRAVRPGDPTVEVLLESGDRVRVHARRLLAHPVAVGASLDPGAHAALLRAAAADAAERRALGLIARRPRSRAELAPRMAAWGLGAEDVAAVLDRLHGLGACDDAALASALVADRRAQGHGRLRIQADMRRLGVDPAAGVEPAATTAAAEAARARAVLVSRYGGPPRDPAGIRRAAAFLARRGYDDDAVASALGIDGDC
jgi:regulatory protein